jgi:hypothetical protein
MTTDVLRLQGNYLIQTNVNVSGVSAGGTLTLDVGSQNGISTGTVFVNGNLVVRGTQTTINTTDAAIRDNIITLNAGEASSAVNGAVSLGTSGIKISRGRAGADQDQFAAFFIYNDTRSWQGTGAISSIQGLWELRTGVTGRPQYSALKLNAIRIDENSASTSGAGAGQGARLNIFGSDNPTSVISVSGTNNYASRVTDPDDIPNKAYVDNLLVSTQATAERVVIGNSYITLKDTFNDGVTSEAIVVLNGDPEERLSITTGTQVMRLTPEVAQFAGVQFIGNQIGPVNNNTDLNLKATGTGQIVLESPLLFQSGSEPTPGIGETGLFVGESSGGGTGVYFKKRDLLGNITQDEFTSRKKALIYSIIFG